ncbi:hypothetical protein TeGR_g12966, partial [Tetraparma gracilis]
FTLDGADCPGLINGLADILGKHGMNIDRVETTVDHEQPHGGTSLFQMEGICVHPGPLPEEWSPEAIIEELEDWADANNCDVALESMDEGGDWDEGQLMKDFHDEASVQERKYGRTA